jgi:hypothetical protein
MKELCRDATEALRHRDRYFCFLGVLGVLGVSVAISEQIWEIREKSNSQISLNSP